MRGETRDVWADTQHGGEGIKWCKKKGLNVVPAEWEYLPSGSFWYNQRGNIYQRSVLVSEAWLQARRAFVLGRGLKPCEKEECDQQVVILYYPCLVLVLCVHTSRATFIPVLLAWKLRPQEVR